MNKIMTICAAFLMTASMYAQSPNKMSYQAVIRNSSNALVTNSTIGMRISILKTSPTGTAVYVETQTPTTNANGLVSIEIGGGSVVSGNFSVIDWANGPYFVKTETDVTGGSNYTITGTSQLLSVPYALHAKTVEIDNVQDGDTTYWKVNGNNLYYNNGFIGINTNNPISVMEIRSLPIASAPGLALSRPVSTLNNAIPFRFYLNNQGNNIFRYAEINGGISSNITGQELGFMSFSVADGTGNWGISYQQEKMRLTNIGLGIGINTPARNLHVKDVIRLEPRTSTPTSPAKGDMYFDNTLNKLRVYDGTTWQNCW
jgi:hypothetical protein